MGRKKRTNKNVTVSISLPPKMVEEIDLRVGFNLSKAVQVWLGEYLQANKFVEDEDVNKI